MYNIVSCRCGLVGVSLSFPFSSITTPHPLTWCPYLIWYQTPPLHPTHSLSQATPLHLIHTTSHCNGHHWTEILNHPLVTRPHPYTPFIKFPMFNTLSQHLRDWDLARDEEETLIWKLAYGDSLHFIYCYSDRWGRKIIRSANTHACNYCCTRMRVT